MSTKHTPGPWKQDKVFGLIVGPNGEEVAAIHAGTEAGRQNLETANYNARLIAAAPELLDALKKIESCLNPEDSDPAAQAVRAAITKAEGQS